MSRGAASPDLRILPGVTVDAAAVWFTHSRSGGPGGQNVNKVNTRVTLRCNLALCASLSDAQRRRIRQYLPTRVTRDGVLMIAASRHRTQAANRKAATERFIALLAEALTPRKKRRKTAVPKAVRRRRLDDKRRRSQTKVLRSRVAGAEKS